MKDQKDIVIKPDHVDSFQNHANFCIGTGRMDLALHAEYQEELRKVQEACHFQYIRGHGLFSDGMAIYSPWTDDKGKPHEGYNFTYLDRVMDFYLSIGLKPFLEIGFMPSQLARGDQTLFYWKANVTPPKSESKWIKLVEATLVHLFERYGYAEVVTWPVEIWNEPNLPGFWKDADRKAYFRLYEITSQAIENVCADMEIGGPAVCGGNDCLEWIHDFIVFVQRKRLPLDFLTRHVYMGKEPERHGKYLYHDMRSVEAIVGELQDTRKVLQEFPFYASLPIYVTEFNTSYHPFCPIHDTLQNGAILCSLLARLGDVAQSYSYWTFGDVFEEQGVPPTLFHGGFGLMAAHSIPKPSFWAMKFFTGLEGRCIYRDKNLIVTLHDDGDYELLLWNASRDILDRTILIPEQGRWTLLEERVDESHGNPLEAWLNMGSPSEPSKGQVEILCACAQPETIVKMRRQVRGPVRLVYHLEGYGWIHVCMGRSPVMQDYGYMPDRYL